MDLHGRIALVTGASGGIGYATAKRLAEAGADVVLSYSHDKQTAEDLAASLRQMGRKALAVQADLSDPQQVLALVDTTERELGPIDILISNAGRGQRLPLEEITLDEWDTTMNVNVRPSFLFAQRVIPGMKERKWGRIIFVSSVAAFTGGSIGPHYATSKAALAGLMHSLAATLAPHGVTVNIVAPALIEHTKMLPGGPELALRIPVGRLGQPEEVASAIASFVDNAYITNQTLLVDGGMYPH
jgi:3-oxoacyl-[acyl-carrier protein] reductase